MYPVLHMLHHIHRKEIFWEWASDLKQCRETTNWKFDHHSLEKKLSVKMNPNTCEMTFSFLTVHQSAAPTRKRKSVQRSQYFCYEYFEIVLISMTTLRPFTLPTYKVSHFSARWHVIQSNEDIRSTRDTNIKIDPNNQYLEIFPFLFLMI